METQSTVRTLDVYPVEERYVEVDVEIQRTPEALNQRYCARLRRLTVIASSFDQMTCNGASDDAQHLTH